MNSGFLRFFCILLLFGFSIFANSLSDCANTFTPKHSLILIEGINNKPVKIKSSWGPVFPSVTIYTKALLREAIKLVENKEIKKILIIGTGAAYDAITISNFTDAALLATDISEPSVRAALDNVALNEKEGQIKVIESDLFSEVKGRYDLILFNAPRPYSKEVIQANISDFFAPDITLNEIVLNLVLPNSKLMPAEKRSELCRAKLLALKKSPKENINLRNRLANYVYENIAKKAGWWDKSDLVKRFLIQLHTHLTEKGVALLMTDSNHPIPHSLSARKLYTELWKPFGTRSTFSIFHISIP